MPTSSKESAAALAECKELLKQEKPRAALNSALQAVTYAADNEDRKGEAAAWTATTQVRIALGKYEEALKSGEAALVICLELGNEEGKAEALFRIAEVHLAMEMYAKAEKAGAMAVEALRKLNKNPDLEQEAGALCVQVQLQKEDFQRAMGLAKGNQTELEGRGHKKAAAMAMHQVFQVALAMAEPAKAKAFAKDAIAAHRAAGQPKEEADMLVELANISASLGKHDEAKHSADSALALYKEQGDTIGISAAQNVLGAIEDAKALMKQRDADLNEVPGLVSTLKDSISSRNGADFTEAMRRLYENPSVTQKDIDDACGPLIEQDPEGVQGFMQDNLPSSAQSDNMSFSPKPPAGDFDDVFFRPCDQGYQLDRRLMYLMTRIGGMGYGPSFRLVKNGWTVRPGGWQHRKGAGTLNYRPGQADWESGCRYSTAGMLDCALQVSMTMYQQIQKSKPEHVATDKDDPLYNPPKEVQENIMLASRGR